MNEDFLAALEATTKRAKANRREKQDLLAVLNRIDDYSMLRLDMYFEPYSPAVRIGDEWSVSAEVASNIETMKESVREYIRKEVQRLDEEFRSITICPKTHG